MIFDKEADCEKKIIIQCDCGMEILQLTRYTWDDDGSKDYYIDLFYSAFTTEQTGNLARLKARFKAAWYIFFKGRYRLTEVVLTEKNMEDLKKAIKDM